MGQELFPLQWRMDAARKLRVDKAFVHCPVEAGDEIFVTIQRGAETGLGTVPASHSLHQ